jgi:hypothetical protein
MSPETQSRIGDVEDFLAVYLVVAVVELLRVVARQHFFEVAVAEVDALYLFPG